MHCLAGPRFFLFCKKAQNGLTSHVHHGVIFAINYSRFSGFWIVMTVSYWSSSKVKLLCKIISDQKVTFVVTVSDFVSLSLCAWKNHQEELGMHGETFVLFWLADSLCHSLIGCWDQTLNISISKVANQSTVVCVGIFLYCYTLLAVPGNYFLRFWGKNPSSWRMGRAAAILVLLIHKIVS